MSTVFFTGFPGFLGSALLPHVLARTPDATASCLVQTKFLELARRRAAELEREHPELTGRVQLVEGDITAPDLGLAAGFESLAAETSEIYHLAAVYDLSVARRVAMRVNVDGTRHMLDFAQGCGSLRRFQYVSTCYVSGTYSGAFTEADLEKGQSFNNYYEETKYLAEVEVQERMRGGLPATVYRPAIVVGDSRTGETQKFDGPYYIIRWLLRQPAVAMMPMVGDPGRTRVNLVPRDFVIAALAYLSGLDRSAGKVYQLADPDPLTVDELTDVIARATDRRVLRVPLPKGVAKAALDYVPGVYRLMQIPSASVDYFVHPTHYTSFETQTDLAESGITCPRFPTYVDRLVDFVKKHPEIDSKAMV
jgi:thioester reductase-like protein